MKLYRFKFVRGLEAISSIERRFRDDLDALDEAAKLVVEFDVQIWEGDKKIAHVKKGNAPLNARDPYGN